MKKFYIKSIGFWFILSVIALINAIIRELTYKPLLTPYIGKWAHQISSITGILLIFGAIYIFLKRIKNIYSKNDLIFVGLIWIFMTVIFESLMSILIRKLSFADILQAYYFWQGETWIFVLISLVVSPLIIHKMLKKN